MILISVRQVTMSIGVCCMTGGSSNCLYLGGSFSSPSDQLGGIVQGSPGTLQHQALLRLPSPVEDVRGSAMMVSC
jgi:hypothetical protein